MSRHGFFDHPGPIAMAHRGDHRRFTENTLEAFAAAIALGFRFIESDIHASADGVAVLSHDPDLKRIAGRPEKISQLTWSQLEKVRLPCGSRLGRLDEALEAFPETRFNLDAKAWESVPALARTLQQHQERVCVGSFSHARNRKLRELLPRAAHSASPREVAALRFGTGKVQAHAAMIPVKAGPISLATKTLIERAHQDGRSVHIWTVNRAEEMAQLLDRGVDGLMTDAPEDLKSLFEDRGLW